MRLLLSYLKHSLYCFTFQGLLNAFLDLWIVFLFLRMIRSRLDAQLLGDVKLMPQKN